MKKVPILLSNKELINAEHQYLLGWARNIRLEIHFRRTNTKNDPGWKTKKKAIVTISNVTKRVL